MVAGVKWVGGGGGMKWVGGVSYYFILGTFPARGKLITFYQGHHPPHPLLPLCPPPPLLSSTLDVLSTENFQDLFC